MVLRRPLGFGEQQSQTRAVMMITTSAGNTLNSIAKAY